MTAFQFDAACTLVLRNYENKRDFERFKAVKIHFKRAIRSIIKEFITGKPDVELDPPFEDDAANGDDDEEM